MKKLFLALPLLTIALAGCGNSTTTSTSNNPSQGGGSTDGTTVQPGGSNYVIDLDATGLLEVVEGNKTYPSEGAAFVVSGATFEYSAGVGVAKSSSSDEKGYTELKVMQFSANKADATRDPGLIKNTTALIGISQIKVTWFNTYASEDAKYIPVASCGTAADSLTAVTPNEEMPQTGVEETGYTNKYQIYRYQTTYNVTGSYFSVGACGYATYIQQIEIL